MLGSQMDPTDTLGNPGDYLSATYGGSPHLRGVEAARWNGTEGTLVDDTLTPLAADELNAKIK